MVFPPAQTHPVLLVNLARHFGGAEVRVLETARGLAEAGASFAVAVIEGSALHLALKELGLPALPLDLGRADFRLLPALLRMIREGGFKVVDAHNVQSFFWALPAAHLARCPVALATVHSSFGLTETGAKAFFYEQTLRLACRLATGCIAVSDSVQTYLEGIGVASGRIRLIPNGLDLLPSASDGNRDSRTEFGWDSDPLVLIAVGRLEPVKGLDYLLQALAAALPKEPRLRLLLVGQGRCRDELEAQAQALGIRDRVHFAGFRTDVKALLGTADIFCIPSLSEGLPFALLEACNAALPVVATAVGGMAALLEDGRTAVLVPPRDAHALAAALLKLAADADLCARLGAAARALIERQPTREAMLVRTFEAYGLGDRS